MVLVAGTYGDNLGASIVLDGHPSNACIDVTSQASMKDLFKSVHVPISLYAFSFEGLEMLSENVMSIKSYDKSQKQAQVESAAAYCDGHIILKELPGIVHYDNMNLDELLKDIVGRDNRPSSVRAPEPTPEPTPEPVYTPEPTPEPVYTPEPTPEPVEPKLSMSELLIISIVSFLVVFIAVVLYIETAKHN